jgi:hypothetical protein
VEVLEAANLPKGGNEFHFKVGNIRGDEGVQASLVSNHKEIHVPLCSARLQVGRGVLVVEVVGDKSEVVGRHRGKESDGRVGEDVRVPIRGVLPVGQDENAGEGEGGCACRVDGSAECSQHVRGLIFRVGLVRAHPLVAHGVVSGSEDGILSIC